MQRRMPRVRLHAFPSSIAPGMQALFPPRRFVLPERHVQLPGGIRIELYQPAPRDHLMAHDHDVACLNLVLDGAITETRADGRRELTMGCLSLLPRHTVHEVEVAARAASVLHVEFSGAFLERLPARFQDALPGNWVQDANSLALAKRFRAELQHADALSSLAFEALSIEALMHLLRQHESGHASVPAWLAELAAGWRDDPGRPVRIAECARVQGLSAAGLARSFKRHFGQTIGDYVLELRIEAACRELEQGRESLSDIAARLGFADQSHFTRAFRRVLGATPKVYRDRERRTPATGAFRA